MPKYRIRPESTALGEYFIIEKKVLWWWSYITNAPDIQSAKHVVAHLQQKAIEL